MTGTQVDAVRHGPRVTHRRVLSWIYGLVVCAAVLAAASDLPSAWEVAVYVFGTLVAYWLAETYAHVLATHTVENETVTRTEVWEDVREGWVLVTASFLPLLVLLVVSTFASLGAAVYAAIGACSAGLFGAGWAAAYARGLRGRVRLFVAALIAAVLGLAMALFKFALH